MTSSNIGQSYANENEEGILVCIQVIKFEKNEVKALDTCRIRSVM